MPLTVLDNAYLRKAEQHPNYSETHKKILYMLMHEKKYYTKYELLCLANYSEDKLDKAINELEQTGTIKTEGWLVKLAEIDTLNQAICAEIRGITLRKNK